MDKKAQKRSLLDKAYEFTNLNGRSTEAFFNPEFKSIMNNLRVKTDDPIRALVTGESVGKAAAPADGASLKQLVSSAKSNLNRREYMKAVSDLGRFHHKMSLISTIIQAFDGNVNSSHEQFLLQDLDDESKSHLHDLKTRFTAKASENDLFTKQAGLSGIMDSIKNVVTTRGRALASWERLYPKQIKKLKEDSAKLLEKAESVLNKTNACLKQMAWQRAGRKVGEYASTASIIVKEYVAFDKQFKDYYDQNVKNFLQNQQLVEKVDLDTKKEESPSSVAPVTQNVESKDLVPQKSEVKPEDKSPVKPEVALLTEPTPSDVSPAPDTVKKLTEIEDESPNTLRSEKLEPSPGTIRHSPAPPAMDKKEMTPPAPSKPVEVVIPKAPLVPDVAKTLLEDEKKTLAPGKMAPAHAAFYATLESMSNEHPLILKNYISKYAELIRLSDSKTSRNLIKIAQSI